MRMKVGDEVMVCNENQQCYQMKITDLQLDLVLGELMEKIADDSELPLRVTIAQGLPKGDKFEWVLQKGTECGAYGFIPVKMERSVVNIEAKKAGKKLERWAKIVKEAAEQSHRSYLPTVHGVVDFKGFLDFAKQFEVCLFAYEKTDQSRLKQILMALTAGTSMLVLIGPEGGISEKEASLLCESGFVPLGLGPRILRTETAPIYLLSAISYEFENRG